MSIFYHEQLGGLINIINIQLIMSQNVCQNMVQSIENIIQQNETLHLDPAKKIKRKNIIIDLTNTHYSILKEISQKILYWKTIHKKQLASNQQPDIIWTDFYISQDSLRNMLPFQKINHFPSSFQLGNKYNLAKNLCKMKKKFAQQYNYFPETWMMPDDFERLKLRQQKVKNTWIFKPSSSSQGKGIVITKNLDLIQQKIRSCKKNSQFIIQKYISNPFLIQQLKFDLRIYVLIKSFSPLKIYKYNEGLARFATYNYHKPYKSNMNNVFMHLTNYAINKKNPNFIFSQSNQNQGHKRTYSSIIRMLSAKGYDVKKLENQIDSIIIKTICCVQPLLSHLYKTSAPNKNSNFDNCFEILGFDILIDELLKPFLLEVNHTPSFRTDSQLDYNVKSNLIKDTLILIHHKPKSKTQSRKNFNQIKNRSYNLNKILKQKNITNGYIKIYPVQGDSDPYQKYIEYSHLIFDLWTGIIRKNFTEIPDNNQMVKKNITILKSNKSNLQVKNNFKNGIKKYKNGSIKDEDQKEPKENEQEQKKKSQYFQYDTSHLTKKERSPIIEDSSFTEINILKRYQTKQQDSLHNFLQKRSTFVKKRNMQNKYENGHFHKRTKTKIYTKRQYLSKLKDTHSSCNNKQFKVIQFPLN